MSEVVHVKVSDGNTLILPTSLNNILKSKEIPDELDIVIIDRKPKDVVEKVLGCFDFDDELLDKADRLELEQWLTD